MKQNSERVQDSCASADFHPECLVIWVLCSAELLSVATIKQRLFLYRCVLNFDLTTVSLCLISPGKDLRSQLPSAKNATCDECIFPVRQGLWTDNVFY